MQEEKHTEVLKHTGVKQAERLSLCGAKTARILACMSLYAMSTVKVGCWSASRLTTKTVTFLDFEKKKKADYFLGK